MNLRKRATESIIVALGLVMMCGVAQTAAAGPEAKEVAMARTAVTEGADLGTNGTAGIVVSMDAMEANALEIIDEASISIAQISTTMVAAAEEEPQEPVMSEEERLWQTRLMANVNEFLYVRAAGDENADIVGKMYKGDVAEILEIGDVWTHIKSGNVDGYVSNEYCVMGQDALAYAKANFDTVADILTDGLRVRGEASEEGSIITVVSTGTSLTVSKEADAVAAEGWVPVLYGGTTRYVSADHVSLSLDLGEAITIEEEQEELARIAAEEAAKKAAQITYVEPVQNDAVTATVDELTLLAGIIQCEAGGESAEGQLAVGAVVMNRVRSGSYPSTIYDVIYQRGQFAPAGSGKLANVIAGGVKDSCVQAAQEALNGTDNTGGALHFKSARSGHAGLVIGNHVFY